MLFVNKLCSHLKYYNITHGLFFQYEPNKRLPVQSQQLKQSLKYVHS